MAQLTNIPQAIEKKMLPQAATNDYIGNGIAQNKNLLVARFGGTEGRAVAKIIFKHPSPTEISDALRTEARMLSGITPPTLSNLKKFAVEYLNAASKADLLGVWDFQDGHPTQILLAEFTENKNYCHFEFLDPLYSLHAQYAPWTAALKGKRVLVIHPFTETIESQYNKRNDIAAISKLLPEFHLLTLKPPVTFGTYNEKYSYLDELQLTKKKILCIDFDVAIIGAGGYGLPLAAFIRDIGKTAIHLGGATQLLFGIIGKRWEGRKHMTDLLGESSEDWQGWVRPSMSETPAYANKVGLGSYW